MRFQHDIGQRHPTIPARTTPALGLIGRQLWPSWERPILEVLFHIPPFLFFFFQMMKEDLSDPCQKKR